MRKLETIFFLCGKAAHDTQSQGPLDFLKQSLNFQYPFHFPTVLLMTLPALGQKRIDQSLLTAPCAQFTQKLPDESISAFLCSSLLADLIEQCLMPERHCSLHNKAEIISLRKLCLPTPHMFFFFFSCLIVDFKQK